MHWGGTSPLHHPYTSACTLIGARQHRPFSSFTSPPSTPIFDKTSHPPPHTPNSFTFKRVQTPLTQLPSRVQAQITNSLSRVQARFAPQVFWSSGPRAFSHPGFCGLILHIVHYPIPGLYLTPSRIFGFTLHIFSDTTRPSICSYHVCGVQSSRFFFFFLISFFPSPWDLPVSCCLGTSVVRSRSTGWPSSFSLSRVQTQITHSFSRDQTRLIIPSQKLRLDSFFPVMRVTRLLHPLSTVQDRLFHSLSRVQSRLSQSLSTYYTKYRI